MLPYKTGISLTPIITGRAIRHTRVLILQPIYIPYLLISVNMLTLTMLRIDYTNMRWVTLHLHNTQICGQL